MLESSALLATYTATDLQYEGFLQSKVHGAPEYHWVRIKGVNPQTGSPAHAAIEAAASLEELLGGAGALGHVCSRLRCAPSVQHFVADLQEVLERLTYTGAAGAGPGSGAVAGRPGAGRAAPGLFGKPGCAGGAAWSGGSSRLMLLLLRDLDAIGWDCLEELDQDVARLTLLHLDRQGREHRLRLSLQHGYPASPPIAATDLPVSFAFTWKAPVAAQHRAARDAATGVGPAVAGPGEPTALQGGSGGCSSIAEVYEAFKQAVSHFQPLWSSLDDLERRARVLDPPPTVSAARRHVGPPARRLALGGAASLQLRLDPADPKGPPLPASLAFLGPPDAVAKLREAFFDRLHLWSRDRMLADNLEDLLMQRLPGPAGSGGAGRRRQGDTDGMDLDVDRRSEGWRSDEEQDSVDNELAECPICQMHLLPVADPEAEGDGEGEEAAVAGCAGGGGGLVPDVVCPTPACGLTFHSPCLAEWLRSLSDTRVSFNKLFGRCPFCSNPITVRA